MLFWSPVLHLLSPFFYPMILWYWSADESLRRVASPAPAVSHPSSCWRGHSHPHTRPAAHRLVVAGSRVGRATTNRSLQRCLPQARNSLCCYGSCQRCRSRHTASCAGVPLCRVVAPWTFTGVRVGHAATSRSLRCGPTRKELDQPQHMPVRSRPRAPPIPHTGPLLFWLEAHRASVHRPLWPRENVVPALSRTAPATSPTLPSRPLL
jgi:hypothetical protein